MRKIGAIIFMFILLLIMGNCVSSCGCGGGESGGNCRYCGVHTNWTYRNGGYVCYYCDKNR